MRALSRTVASIFVALMLAVALAVPAYAGQIISYTGKTSAPSQNRIIFKVVKRDSGRLLLRSLKVHYTLTCEDGTVTPVETFGSYWPLGIRLSEAGEFSYDFVDRWSPSAAYYAVGGEIGFRKASGTVEFVLPDLTDGDPVDAQVCTTGELTWTAERTGSRPGGLTASNVPEGTGTTVRVIDGVAKVSRLVEP